MFMRYIPRFYRELLPAFVCLRADYALDLLDLFGNINWLGCDNDLAGFYLAHVKNIVDKPQQMVA